MSPPGHLSPFLRLYTIVLLDQILGAGKTDLSWYGVTAAGDKTVTRLPLSTNKLREVIPVLSALTSLRVLDLGTNELSGSIPDLSALTRLIRLYLDNNRLTGTIPSLLGSIPRLNTLYLERNQLSGFIPTSLRSITDSDLDSLGLRYCDEPTFTPPHCNARLGRGKSNPWSTLRSNEPRHPDGLR